MNTVWLDDAVSLLGGGGGWNYWLFPCGLCCGVISWIIQDIVEYFFNELMACCALERMSQQHVWWWWCRMMLRENSSLLEARPRDGGRRTRHRASSLARVAGRLRDGSLLPILWQDLPQEVQSGDARAHPHGGATLPVPVLSVPRQPLLAPQVPRPQTPPGERAPPHLAVDCQDEDTQTEEQTGGPAVYLICTLSWRTCDSKDMSLSVQVQSEKWL